VAVGPSGGRSRLLLLTPRWLYPVIGGDRLRIWHLAREAALQYDLTLVSLCQTQAELDAPLPDDGVFKSVHRVLLPRWRSWLQMVAALAGGRPLQVAYYDCRELGALVDDLLSSHDLVWCHLVRVAPYALRYDGPRWLEMTDAISLTMERAVQTRARWSPIRQLFHVEASRMRRFEQDMVARFDLTTFVGEVDRAAVVGGGADAAQVVVAPNGVDAVRSPMAEAGMRPLRVALLGRMDSLANRDALHWFTTRVWPAILREAPAARLHIVGHVPPRDARRLRRLDGVVLEGVVPDLATVLGQCRVGVCPVRIGAGMQNKVLDYMAHGVAAVTSPVGLEGLGAVPGTHVMVAESAAQWTATVVRLLTDASTATAIARQGRDLVRRHHRWPESLAPAMRALGELLAEPDHTRRP
jgi:glycosyltransferase involved in cell wall biosynthesis